VARGPVRDGERADFRQRCLDWFARGGFDVLITPTLAGPPPPAARWSTRSWPANLAAGLRYAPYPAVWNVAGLPAVTVPIGVRGDGLPGSVQLVGPPGSELNLLAVARSARRTRRGAARPGLAPERPTDRTPGRTPDRAPAGADRGGPALSSATAATAPGTHRARPAASRRALVNRGGPAASARPADRATIWT
jgi:hypothetical protein